MARNYIENLIKRTWNRYNSDNTNLNDRDDHALRMLSEFCYADDINFDRYRLMLGVLRSLHDDIVIDKKKLEKFKIEYIIFGRTNKWAF